jgi:hypothetical protein
MFWVALATAIMMLSGEGDDTRAIAALLASLRQAITQLVPDADRRAQALAAVTTFEQTFAAHRQELQAFGKCIEAADRNYQATRADYQACGIRMEAQRTEMRHAIAEVQRKYEAALSPTERSSIAKTAGGQPEAWVLDPSLVAQHGQAQPMVARNRGLEGVAAHRHLTLPRNVVSVMFGPLSTATLGQRYPSAGVVDGGTSYLHQRLSGTDAPPNPADQWHTRVGVLFGLFDDIEAGALFLPFQLSPEFEFQSISVFMTWQFRFDDFDLAARFSFQTPGDGGWAISPGALFGTRGQRVSFHAGVFAPMELGAFGEPKAPTLALNAPVRTVVNLLPTVFLQAETGVAIDDLSSKHTLNVPFGLGAEYTWLLGKRVVELTASFDWDHLLMPNPVPGLSALQPKVFRAAAGVSMYFQAL